MILFRYGLTICCYDRLHIVSNKTISPLCHLIEGKPHDYDNIKWLTQLSCLILESMSTLDNENNEFAIDWLLVKITFSSHRLLSVNTFTLKGFLLGKEIELTSIPFILFSLIIILYFGLKKDGSTVVFDPFHIYRESTAVTPILIRFLTKNNRNKQNENIIMIKQECLKAIVTQIEDHTESCETIDLCIGIICLYDVD
ncbi:unnamed protein product [Rotaria sp. Silwood1]|nr:unnamed protein product [Rotaria sp. Silwood1]CAF4927711.1 unnamed protein product [Rotaria sp. Silwood1]